MPTTLSPLRYPGGKTKLYSYVRELLRANELLGKTYIEPFAGGAGLSIKLLLKGDVERIVINDLDPSIYCFWSAILDSTEDFCELIAKTEITIEEWHRQKAVYNDQDMSNPLELGFATFFLNRTNISGVIKGGVIGGINQTGAHTMDARYNKEGLIIKIRKIASRKKDIFIHNLDAQEFLRDGHLRKYYKAFIYFDPPYVQKGAILYKNSFTETDHRHLAENIADCGRKWIVTYDVCSLVTELYSSFRHSLLDITYSVKLSKKANEYIFFSDNMVIPPGFDYSSPP